MEIESLSVPFVGQSLQVVEVNWSNSRETIVKVLLNESGERAEVTFEHDFGVRILDESYLANFWLTATEGKLSESWLFLVKSGGWYDFESTRNDFQLKHQKLKIIEYLITGYNECVSILTDCNPKIKKI